MMQLSEMPSFLTTGPSAASVTKARQTLFWLCPGAASSKTRQLGSTGPGNDRPAWCRGTLPHRKRQGRRPITAGEFPSRMSSRPIWSSVLSLLGWARGLLVRPPPLPRSLRPCSPPFGSLCLRTASGSPERATLSTWCGTTKDTGRQTGE